MKKTENKSSTPKKRISKKHNQVSDNSLKSGAIKKDESEGSQPINESEYLKVEKMIDNYAQKYIDDPSQVYSMPLSDLVDETVELSADEILSNYDKLNDSKDIAGYSYYRQIFVMIKENIEQKKLKEAVALIEEELEMPYIPKEVEDAMHSFENVIFQILNKHQEDSWGHLSASALIEKAFSNFPANLTLLEVALNKPQGFFSREQFAFIAPYFSSSQTESHWKVYMFDIFSKIPEFNGIEIEIHNPNTKQTTKAVIGGQISSQETITFFETVSQTLSELVADEPSLTSLAISIADRIALFYYPKHPKLDPVLLAQEIVEYVYRSLNHDVSSPAVKKSEITKLIDEVLTKIDI
ncbi:DUF3196 family protein [[Mycoplasma] testudinis]|uniref:DUF3196 family protein n=1 Tax=[Mycoplasma] testudinis TaxID=33924 RepID=UPI000485291B|nr:DUF3196 family protein [[Mycoplasma] testudinis]